MSDRHRLAPHPNHRLIPSRFPPVGLFDSVTTAADLEAVMELAGWTNDRLVAERIARLPQAEWVYGRPNSSIVMAAFLHVAPTGMRFNGPELGAWYVAADLPTAAAEVAHHLRREAVARRLPEMRRVYRAYGARLHGRFLDICGRRDELAELYAPDSYVASQAFGEAVRSGADPGIVYDSVRYAGGVNAVAFRPSRIRDVVQESHLEISVTSASRRIGIRMLGQ